MYWIVYPSPLILNVSLLRDSVFKEVVKCKWGHNGEALSDRTDELYKEKEIPEFSVLTISGHGDKMDIGKPGRELLLGTKSCKSLGFGLSSF